MLNEKRPSFLTSNQHISKKGLLFLIAFFCLTLIALLAIAITTLITSQRIDKASTRNVDQIADSQAALVIQWLETLKNDAAALASSPAGQQLDVDSVRALFVEYQKQGKTYDDFFIAGVDGLTIENDNELIVDLSEREYFQEALSGKAIIAGPFISKASGHIIIVAAAPIQQEGTVVGVVGLVAPTNLIQESLNTVRFGETGEVYLIDSNGMLVTSSRYTEELLGMNVIDQQSELELIVDTYAATQIAQKQNGSSVYDNYLDQQVFGSYRYIPETGWGVVVEQQESEIQAKVLPPRMISILFFLLAGMDFLAILVTFAIYFTKIKILRSNLPPGLD